MARARIDGEQGKPQQSGPESSALACLNMLFLGACTAISRQLFQRLRLQSRRVFGEIITRWHCFHRLHFVVKLMRAVKTYFVLDAEQSIAAAIFAEGLDAENCLPTEYSGYASATAVAAVL